MSWHEECHGTKNLMSCVNAFYNATMLAGSLRHPRLQANSLLHAVTKPSAANRLTPTGAVTCFLTPFHPYAPPTKRLVAPKPTTDVAPFQGKREGLHVLEQSEELATRMYQRMAQLQPEIDRIGRWIRALENDLHTCHALPGMAVRGGSHEQPQKTAWLAQLRREAADKAAEMQSLVHIVRQLNGVLKPLQKQPASATNKPAHRSRGTDCLSPELSQLLDTCNASPMAFMINPCQALFKQATVNNPLQESLKAGLATRRHRPSPFGLCSRRHCSTTVHGPDRADKNRDNQITEEEWIREYGSRDGFQEFDKNEDGVLDGEEMATLRCDRDRPRYWEADNWKTERYAAPPPDGRWGLIGAHPDQYPTLREAAQQQRHYYEYSNHTLLILALQGNTDACVERLIREIMDVDQVHWRVAAQTVVEMETTYSSLATRILRMPYTIGATGATVAGFAALPMVFSTNFCLWFNANVVTAEMPPPEDLQTVMETGMWSWGWMEPPLGAISFLLLCLQFARNQTANMWIANGGQGPYNAWLKKRRFAHLTKAYPDYSPIILQEYCQVVTARSGRSTAAKAVLNDDRYNSQVSSSNLEGSTYEQSSSDVDALLMKSAGEGNDRCDVSSKSGAKSGTDPKSAPSFQVRSKWQ